MSQTKEIRLKNLRCENFSPMSDLVNSMQTFHTTSLISTPRKRLCLTPTVTPKNLPVHSDNSQELASPVLLEKFLAEEPASNNERSESVIMRRVKSLPPLNINPYTLQFPKESTFKLFQETICAKKLPKPYNEVDFDSQDSGIGIDKDECEDNEDYLSEFGKLMSPDMAENPSKIASLPLIVDPLIIADELEAKDPFGITNHNLSSSVCFKPIKREDCSWDENSQSKRQCLNLFSSPSSSGILKELNVSQNTLVNSDLQSCCFDSSSKIQEPLQSFNDEQDLIGNFTQFYSLPCISGCHRDLKSITGNTLYRLLNNEFKHSVDSYIIIDCRYPYEFEGGHITSAKNIYTKEDLVKELLTNPRSLNCKNGKHSIVIFHCEFSSKRGPSMSRFLRNQDREINKECYPYLFYPEIYILHGGYKAFYESYPAFCEPQQYKPMRHKDHADDLKHFHTKSKSLGSERNQRNFRAGLKF